ncbi:hypothetical protein [Pseudomonas sp. HTZ1]|uniref:hypothetical protein n=1 Tax=Pseudomonas sp. HTZ1 TaxID=3075219 RepID=UPI00287BEC27|nr:hypothetical protein [Pseudomonas sp. HTZ1]MDS9589747.1 hypothetical protein [Pseudomonas sp. HTZ1]
MVTHHQLRSLEIAKRRALWALADLQPGDSRAELPLLEIDEVDQALKALMSGNELSSQELVDSITTQFHNGLRLVIENSIPEPWRQRFMAASVDSTRVAAGPYFHDFEKFALTWSAEMANLEAHCASRQGRCSK